MRLPFSGIHVPLDLHSALRLRFLAALNLSDWMFAL